MIVSSALFFLLLTIGTTLTEAQGAITRWGAFVYTGNTPYGPPSNTLVNGYAINTTAGTLTKVAGSPFATGGQVLAIASHPSGRFAYVASGNGTVAAFTVDSLDGSLTVSYTHLDEPLGIDCIAAHHFLSLIHIFSRRSLVFRGPTTIPM